jgi:dihydroneopterin aldolase
MSASEELDAVTAGVRDAWDFWLSQHDVSVPDRIEDAVRSAVEQWMNDNADRLIERIAERVAEQTKRDDQ